MRSFTVVLSSAVAVAAINVKPSDLLTKLSDGSASCTVDQFRKRFDEFVTDMTRGKDVSKVRIVINKEE